MTASVLNSALFSALQGEVAAEIESLRDMLALSIPSQDDQLLLLCGVYGAYDLAWQMEELLAETPDLDKLANCVALLRVRQAQRVSYRRQPKSVLRTAS